MPVNRELTLAEQLQEVKLIKIDEIKGKEIVNKEVNCARKVLKT